MIFNIESRKGQSLIEAMAALSVLMIGFMGILSLLSKSFFYGRYVSDNMNATYLASEGIELTKSLIDHDVLLALAGNGGGWGSCFSLSPGVSKDFEFDYTANCNTLMSYSDRPLLLDSTTGLYSYMSSGNTSATNFTRLIRVSESADGNEITVKSIVSWSTGYLVNQSVSMEDQFYNWRLE